MAPRSDTRDRTLRTAVELFRARGYHGTGLNQVLSEGGLPKGSLYFHFPGGKEQLAAEAVDLAGGQLRTAMAEVLAAAEDPAAGMSAIIDHLIERMTASDFTLGCPVGTIAQDADADRVREACARTFAGWHDLLVEHLRHHGFGDRSADLATTLLALVEGAQLLARTCRDTAPLRAVAATARHLLERH